MDFQGRKHVAKKVGNPRIDGEKEERESPRDGWPGEGEKKSYLLFLKGIDFPKVWDPKKQFLRKIY